MKENNAISLLYNILSVETAYVIGGFFRDFLYGKNSRDIDIIVDIKRTQLIEIISSFCFPHKVNRYGGIKIKLSDLELDIWSIEDNWAFKNNLVKLNENDKLNSIAKGCFYNYDSLVINLHNFSYNLKYYKDFVKNNQLDILQKKSIYKNLNPSVEANIIRAFYIKYRFNSSLSDNTYLYVSKKLGHLRDKYGNVLSHLNKIKQTYPKYNELNSAYIECCIEEIKKNNNYNNQYLLDF
ncbi:MULTISPECIES: hypothetical protein [Capnocytophaga]|uniref:hypothetical protein n=1 Tax=Capnocytophaga TaxID=1016 RepID=UPI0012FF8B0A|nr:hypothetical protein [Capnocytophaga canimorsus]